VRLTQDLRVQSLRVILPRVIGGGIEAEIKPDETTQSYLERTPALASDRLDARMILHIRELQNTLRGEQFVLSALQPLLAAQNQDEARQFAAAVVSYRMALKNGGSLIPTRQIAERLETIKSEHPAEYASGMEQLFKNAPSFPSRSSCNQGTIAIRGITNH
jgi:hypothetical protein